MSILSSPTPSQNCLMPAPEPPELNNRGLEVGVGLAERLGDDLGIGENGGRTGDLDLVAGESNALSGGKRDDGGARENGNLHDGPFRKGWAVGP